MEKGKKTIGLIIMVFAIVVMVGVTLFLILDAKDSIYPMRRVLMESIIPWSSYMAGSLVICFIGRFIYKK